MTEWLILTPLGLVTEEEYVEAPSPWPGAKGLVGGSKQLHLESRIAFEEMDKNCNTCLYLRRVQTSGNTHGLLRGKCGRMDGHPYQPEFWFAPSDYQGSECWKSRRV